MIRIASMLRSARVLLPAAALGLTLGLPAAAEEAAMVNVNSAAAEELMALTNVGEVTARAIVEHREEHGEFESVQALTEVSGIGERTVEMNLDRIELE